MLVGANGRRCPTAPVCFRRSRSRASNHHPMKVINMPYANNRFTSIYLDDYKLVQVHFFKNVEHHMLNI